VVEKKKHLFLLHPNCAIFFKTDIGTSACFLDDFPPIWEIFYLTEQKKKHDRKKNRFTTDK
jgi:hypothetical protein